MDFSDPVQKCLAIDEVLELILEYAASKEPWGDTRALRLVCKRWRSLAFPALCHSKDLPVVKLYHEWMYPLMRPASVKKRYPRTRPATRFLSKPQLPFKVDLGRLPTRDDIQFLTEYSSSIASLYVNVDLGKYDDIKEKYNKKVVSGVSLKLPNLRKLKISWYGILENHKNCFKLFLECIIESSKRLCVLKYEHFWMPKFPNRPLMSPKLTHVNIESSLSDLETLTCGIVKHLTKLELYLSKKSLISGKKFKKVCCNELSQIVARYASTLETLVISNSACLILSGEFKFPKMKLLKKLETDVPFSLYENSSFSGDFPKLTSLEYSVGYITNEDLSVFGVSHLASDSLKEIKLNWEEPEYFLHQVQFENKFLEQLEENPFPEWPRVTDLKLIEFPFSVAISTLPKIFAATTDVVNMEIRLTGATDRQRFYGQGPSQPDTNDLTKMLTDASMEDIPNDESVWPDFLKNKPGSIRNMTSLSNLFLEAGFKSKANLDRFVFVAAFFQMPNLKVLKFGKGVLVNDVLGNEWRSRGRSISYKPPPMDIDTLRQNMSPTTFGLLRNALMHDIDNDDDD